MAKKSVPKLPQLHPFLDITIAAIFLICLKHFNFTLLFFKYCTILTILAIISFIDLKVSIIPNLFVLALAVWGVFWQFVYPEFTLAKAFLGFLISGIIFIVIDILSRGGMGAGDIKLIAVLGFLTGWPNILYVIFLAFVLGAVAGIILIMARKKTKKDTIPFAPFIAIAFLITTLWGMPFFVS
ncbi:MAG: prepilin peptidase [Firmicutes bacterium]|nr:prepilin peptidase [Bacillota bacterium]